MDTKEGTPGIDQLTGGLTGSLAAGPKPVIRTRSQADIDAEASLIRLEHEKLELEMKGLELEKLKHDIAVIRAKNEQQAMSRDAVQESIKFGDATEFEKESLCTHMKGGNADQMLRGAPAQGNDQNNYAMFQHTLTTGVTFRLCSRCGKTWFPGDPDYKWAMTRSTRNSPSTGCPSPGLIRYPEKVQRKSYIPHTGANDSRHSAGLDSQ